MYNYNQIYKIHKETLKIANKNQILKESSIVHTNNLTDNIFDHLKEDAFRKIFKILDSDDDGQISIYYSNLNDLPDNVKHIIRPIFNNLKSSLDSLNEQNFIDALSLIFSVNFILTIKELSYKDKSTIIEFKKSQNKVYQDKKKKNFPKNPSFKVNNIFKYI
jgi:hypothetical protein